MGLLDILVASLISLTKAKNGSSTFTIDKAEVSKNGVPQ
uniref:Uncharacterized protein n=1 Tax=Arcella intermedia TaxID=1963864 RepID=A0A6B2LU30_9EUKA